MDYQAFLTWEKGSDDTTDFKRTYVDMAGDFVAGHVLSVLVYWCLLPGKNGQTKLRAGRKGYKWIAKRRYDWWEEARISPDQFDRAIAILRQKGLVETATFKFQGEPTVHIRVVEDVFFARLEEVLTYPLQNPHLPKNQKRITTNGENAIAQKPTTWFLPKSEIPYTETTTKNTSQTNSSDGLPASLLSAGVPGSGEAPTEPSSQNHPEQLHYLETLIMTMGGYIHPLPPELRQQLYEPVTVHTGGGQLELYPGPAMLYDQYLADEFDSKTFAKWVVSRLQEVANSVPEGRTYPSRKQMMAALRNYSGNPGGWLAYKHHADKWNFKIEVWDGEIEAT